MMTSPPIRRGMPRTLTSAELCPVYKLRQPGRRRSPMGAEKHRNSLGRSASLVLYGNAPPPTAPDSGGPPGGGGAEPARPYAHVERATAAALAAAAAAQAKQRARALVEADSMPISPLQHSSKSRDVAAPAWSAPVPYCLTRTGADGGRTLPPIEYGGKELSSRLEACRQRLAAAEFELQNFNPAAYADQKLADSGCGGTKEEEAARSRRGSTACLDVLGEPAPEPPLPTASTYGEATDLDDRPALTHYRVAGAKGAWGDNFKELPSDAAELGFGSRDGEFGVGEGDLRAQLAEIEGRLRQLDAKWCFAEEERRRSEKAAEILVDRLAQYKDREKGLHTRLDNQRAESQALRGRLGVSEDDARDLRARLEASKTREGILIAQANALNARLYTAETRVQALQQELDAAVQSKEAAFEHASSLGEAHQAAEEMRGELADERRRADAAELEWGAAERRAAELEQALEAARETAALASEETRQATAQLRAREEAPSVQPSPLAEEQEGEAALGILDLLLRVRDGGAEEAEGAEEADVRGGGSAPRRPAVCKVDPSRGELRLVPLAVAGPPRVIALEDIANIWRPVGDQRVAEATVTLELAAPSADEATTPKPESLRLFVEDEHFADVLVAALVPDHRARPGELFLPPAGSAAPSEEGSEGSDRVRTEEILSRMGTQEEAEDLSEEFVVSAIEDAVTKLGADIAQDSEDCGSQ